MAHPNIEQRQAKVSELLQESGAISGPVIRELAKMFDCSVSAIKSDIVDLSFQSDVTRHVSAGMRKQIFARDGYRCRYCESTTARMYVIDHVIPYNQGGRATVDNLVVACWICNRRKANQIWEPKPLP